MTLSKHLLGEVGQTEHSAVRHCKIEAERLGACPPGDAMRAVSEHAARMEPEVHRLASARDAEGSKVGAVVGNLFSIGRDAVADLLLTSERSYRGTLLGMRHGRDVVDLVRRAAHEENDRELAAWATTWLAERDPLIAAAASALEWFAEHPDQALKNAKS